MRVLAAILLVVVLIYQAAGAQSPGHGSADHYTRASELARAGKYPAALRELEEAARNDEANPKIHNLRGVVLSQLGRLKEADDAYNRALALSPQFHAARKNRASNAFFLKNFKFASAEFEALAVLLPNDHVPPLFLGLIAIERSDYPRARADLMRARKLAPADARVLAGLVRVYFMLGEREQALEASRTMEALPNIGSDDLFELGVLLAGLDANDQAARVFTRLSKAEPAFYDAAYNLALTQLRAGNFNSALKTADRLSSGWPQTGEVWNLRGRILSRLGRMREAIDSLRRAIAAEPARVENYLDLSTVLMNDGDPAGAERVLRDSIERSPDKDRVYVQFGILSKQNRDYVAAESWYRKALEANPANEATYIALAHMNLLQNREGEAVALLESAVERIPDSALIAYVYGSLLFETAAGDAKKINRARGVLEKSLALNPLFANTHYRLARLHLQSAEPEKAKAFFEKAISLNPKHAEAMYQLSLLLARRGDKKRAAELRKAVQQVHAERDNLLQELAARTAEHSPDSGLKNAGRVR